MTTTHPGPGGPGFNVVPIKPPSAEDHASAETERKRSLFAWADDLLKQLGYTKRLADASSFDDLRKIVFDSNAFDVASAIRDALHPISGRKADHFVGIKEGALKRLLRKRFDEMKSEREAELLRNPRGGANKSNPNRWTNDLKLDKDGKVKPLLMNLVLFLRHHQKWKDVLAFDEFNARVVIRARPPWGDVPPDTPWTDAHDALARIWFQQEEINANFGDLGRAVEAAARANTVNPVRDFFDGLVWDKTPRIDTWLARYLHADESEYTKAVGPRWLISAVARVYKPGCQADHMLVLEGAQGILKSSTLRALAVKDAWFADRLSHLHSKDASMETAGVLLVEIAEMDALTRASSSAMKSFLTRTHERIRLPFGKRTIKWGRQCIFAGSINPTAGGYLRDPTGARRIWPVACGNGGNAKIDRDGIERDRNQLWAEAVAKYKSGAKWWLETPELEKLATAEQAARFELDVWEARKLRVVHWLKEKNEISLPEVLKEALGITEKDQIYHSAEIRVANILKNVGFTKCRPRKGDDRKYEYQRANSGNNPDHQDHPDQKDHQ